MAQSEGTENLECNMAEWNPGDEVKVGQGKSSLQWGPRGSSEKDEGNPQMERLGNQCLRYCAWSVCI